MNLTPNQQKAIAHRDGTMLVAASAGSGKTEVLARRCAALISDAARPCRIDQLLVVTFTRAAAAELRVRLASMLRREAAAMPPGPRRDHVRRQEMLIDTADIGTIDAWCGRLVRENFETIGIDPAFALLSSEDAATLQNEVLDRVFREVYGAQTQADNGAPTTAHRAGDWIARAARPSDDFLRNAVLRLNAFRQHIVSPAAWFAAQREATRQPADQQREAARGVIGTLLAQELALQTKQIELLRPVDIGAFAQVEIAAYRDRLRHWLAQSGDHNAIEQLVAAIGTTAFTDRPRGLPGPDKRILDELKFRWWERRLKRAWPLDAVTRIIEHAPAAAELVRTLLELESQFDALLAAEKQRRAAYEFGDVMRMALDLLGDPGSPTRTPSSIAEKLRAAYEHVLVDEYQDTSPVQVELLRLAARDGSGIGNRFLVGDVKQSIYGFREAEPLLFVELAAALQAGAAAGQLLPLSDNFRSHRGVLEPLNVIFHHLFHPNLGGTSYGDAERLVAQRGETPNPSLDGSPRVELHIIEEGRESEESAETAGDATEAVEPTDDVEAAPPAKNAELAPPPDEMPMERIEREALVAARAIQTLIGDAAQAPSRGGALRPLRYADIVILIRSAAGNAALLAAALRRSGVPAVAIGRESFLDSLETRDLRNILALLANRRHDLAFAAYLRSPIGGLTEQDLLELRAFSDAREFSAAVRRGLDAAAGELRERLAAAIARLDQWELAGRAMPLSVLIRLIIAESNIRLFAQGLPGGAHRVAMIDAFEAKAAEFEQFGGGPAEFAAHLDELEVEGLRPSTASPQPIDAVRIMTIHASKGLEFPVVLLLHAGAEFSRKRREIGVICDEELGIGLLFFDYPARLKLETAARPAIRRLSARRELEEELRLLYVAATRAREKLCIIGHWRAERWDECTAACPEGHEIPLIRRLNAAHLLEWTAMGVAAGGLTRGERPLVALHRHDADKLTKRAETTVPENKSAQPARPAIELADFEWIEQAVRLISTRPDLTLARTPALISVSAAKQSLSAGDIPAQRLARATYDSLAAPRFSGEIDPADGRALGTAVHRFLMLADLKDIATEPTVRRQIDALVAAGRLLREDAQLIHPADISWLGTSEIGEKLANAQRLRREMPFLYAVPITAAPQASLLRGVIDVLIEDDAGLDLVDYKTDLPASAKDWDSRIAGYSAQLGLYALSVTALFGKPVRRAALVFLRARRIEWVEVSVARLEALRASLTRIVADSQGTSR